MDNLLRKNRYRQTVARLKIVAVLVASLCLSGYGGAQSRLCPAGVANPEKLTGQQLLALGEANGWVWCPDLTFAPLVTTAPYTLPPDWPTRPTGGNDYNPLEDPDIMREPRQPFKSIKDRNLVMAIGLGVLMVAVWVGRKRTQKPTAGDDDRPSHG